MKNLIEVKIYRNNNYDDCEYRLSATSRAFCEAHTAGSEWYELIPIIDYSQLATISSQAGDILLTSPVKFINPLYLSFNFDYSFLKKEWEKIVEQYGKEYNGLPLYAFPFPSVEEIKKITIEYFKNEFTKSIKVFRNGELFESLRVSKKQKFFLKIYLITLKNLKLSLKIFTIFLKITYLLKMKQAKTLLSIIGEMLVSLISIK